VPQFVLSLHLPPMLQFNPASRAKDVPMGLGNSALFFAQSAPLAVAAVLERRR